MFLAAGRSGSVVLVSFFLCVWPGPGGCSLQGFLVFAGFCLARLVDIPVLKGHGNARQGEVCIG